MICVAPGDCFSLFSRTDGLGVLMNLARTAHARSSKVSQRFFLRFCVIHIHRIGALLEIEKYYNTFPYREDPGKFAVSHFPAREKTPSAQERLIDTENTKIASRKARNRKLYDSQPQTRFIFNLVSDKKRNQLGKRAISCSKQLTFSNSFRCFGDDLMMMMMFFFKNGPGSQESTSTTVRANIVRENLVKLVYIA